MTTDTDTRPNRGNAFLIGFMTGTLVSAAVAICLAPRSSGLRRRVTEAVRNLGEIADEVATVKRSTVADIKKHASA